MTSTKTSLFWILLCNFVSLIPKYQLACQACDLCYRFCVDSLRIQSVLIGQNEPVYLPIEISAIYTESFFISLFRIRK